MLSLSYQGSKPVNSLELHYFDNDGPIFVNLPREGLERMCGRSLSEDEARLILLNSAERELFQVIDHAVDRCGGFTVAFFENGASFRKLNIAMADIESSNIKIPTDVLTVMAGSGFIDPKTGRF
jgi:hypothetical protein